MSKVKVSVEHSMFTEVDITVHRTNSKKVRLTEPDRIRITKSVRRPVVDDKRKIELIGTLGDQTRQLKWINNHGGQNLLVTIDHERDAIKSTLPSKERYRPVRKKQSPARKLVPVRINADHYAPPGKWKKLGPEPPARPTIYDLAEKINALRNK